MAARMKKRRFSKVSIAVGLFAAGFLLFAQGTPIKIMPLGDSITESMTGAASFRYWLWHMLLDAGYTTSQIDFVGSMKGVYGIPLYEDFDQDHEGHSGYSTAAIADELPSFLNNSDAPDVVMIHLGTNDGSFSQASVNSMNMIIDTLRGRFPSVTILLCRIIPSTTAGPARVLAYNNAWAGVVAAKDSPRSRVYCVDQYTGFDPATMLKEDGVHPSELGEKSIAARYYMSLQPVLKKLLGKPLVISPQSGTYSAYQRFDISIFLRSPGARVEQTHTFLNNVELFPNGSRDSLFEGGYVWRLPEANWAFTPGMINSFVESFTFLDSSHVWHTVSDTAIYELPAQLPHP